MFETLSNRLTSIFDKIRGKGALTEADVALTLREVRVALLEADVALPVAKDFIAQVQEKATGQDILRSITPGQMVIKIVHDTLVDLLGHPDGSALNLRAQAPAVILMVGLQGSGKTTTAAKIAHFLKTRENKKVMMASCDIYRPAAQEQLVILGGQIEAPVLDPIPGEKPLAIAARALDHAKKSGMDVLVIDTAGRLHVDDTLMEELQALHQRLNPVETLLVMDAMMGKDALQTATAFHKKIGVTGCVLSRVDGDARGGSALSLRFVTGKPLKFLGVGEKPTQIEVFHPERIAGRILGMGDVISLVEKVASSIAQEDLEAMTTSMQTGVFTLNDLSKSLTQMEKMGGMGALMGMLPGMGKLAPKLGEDAPDKASQMIRKQQAMISSMTPKERLNPKILGASRKKRIARGSGTTVPELNRLLKQFEDMSTLMKRMSKVGKKGLLRQGLKGLLGQ